MTEKQKANLIGQIITHLRFHRESRKESFDEGDTFFSLCFLSDKELQRIAKLAGV